MGASGRMAAVELTPVQRLALELKKREKETASVGTSVDKQLRARAVSGCFDWVWRALFGRSGAYQAGVGEEEGAKKRAGGLFGAKASPSAKLERAAEAMEARIGKLDEKAEDCKGEAKRLMKAGQKAAAKKALIRSKSIAKQVDVLNASLSAVQSQQDALDNAEVQKVVASALKSTSKGFRANKQVLKTVEDAAEGVQEVRELADDLSVVMGELANGNDDVDDVDLMEELQSMMADEDDPPPPALKVSTPAEDARAAADALAQRHQIYDDAELTRRRLPGVPKGSVEKVGLLSN